MDAFAALVATCSLGLATGFVTIVIALNFTAVVRRYIWGIKEAAEVWR